MNNLIPDDNKKSILYIAHSSDWRGSDKSLYDMIVALKNYINPIVIVPSDGYLVEKLKNIDVECFEVPYLEMFHVDREKKDEYRQFIINLYASIEICDVIKDKNITLVHSNTSVSDVGAIVALRLNVPHVWHFREMLNEQFAGEYWNITIKKQLWNYADKIVSISSTVQDYILKEYGLNSEQVYNYIECSKIISSNRKKENLLFFGGLYERKGVWDAIKAVNYLKSKYNINTKLYIAGSGKDEEIEEIVSYIDDNNLSNNIELVGFKKDLYELMSMCQFALTCSWNEALGRTTVEAMKSGMIVIGANTGGTKEIIGEDNTKGFLYKSQDYFDLAKAIKKAMELSEEKLDIISKNAFDFAGFYFGPSLYAERLMKIYNNCLEKKVDNLDKSARLQLLRQVDNYLKSIAREVTDLVFVEKTLWIRHVLTNTDLATILNQMGHKNVGIYGMSKYGRLLFDELINTNIVVKYIKDKNEQVINEIQTITPFVKAYSVDDDLAKDVVWIVTVINNEGDIVQRLTEKGYYAMGLRELLFK